MNENSRFPFCKRRRIKVEGNGEEEERQEPKVVECQWKGSGSEAYIRKTIRMQENKNGERGLFEGC